MVFAQTIVDAPKYGREEPDRGYLGAEGAGPDGEHEQRQRRHFRPER